MLFYPKIPGSRQAPAGCCWAFEKYDGTNLHWDWDRLTGWRSFGTRRDAFELSPSGIEDFCARHAHLRECVTVFRETLADGLERIFRTHPGYAAAPGCTAFTEFFGPNSFAGLHRDGDPKELRLFDVSLESFGLLGPQRFVEDFREIPSARVVYHGKFTGKFADDVRQGKYPTNEGVVCKFGTGGTDLNMAKIKTDAYLARLKQAFNDRWEDYWE